MRPRWVKRDPTAALKRRGSAHRTVNRLAGRVGLFGPQLNRSEVFKIMMLDFRVTLGRRRLLIIDTHYIVFSCSYRTPYNPHDLVERKARPAQHLLFTWERP